MSKFIYGLKVPYFACDKNGYMTPSYILNYLGEASSAHSDFLGLGFKELSKGSYGWVLNRWKVEFISYPRVKEHVKIETWTSKVHKFYANREFILYNKKGEKLVKASTVWVFLDTEKQKPVRIPKEIEEKYNSLSEQVFQEFYKFKKIDLVGRPIEYFTRRTDIDYNNHVNNVKYLDWILEVLPSQIHNKYSLNKLEIQYKKEVLYGDIITSSINQGEDCKGELVYLHQVGIKDSKSINTYAKTGWRLSE